MDETLQHPRRLLVRGLLSLVAAALAIGYGVMGLFFQAATRSIVLPFVVLFGGTFLLIVGVAMISLARRRPGTLG